jgi:hypothetical protein
MDVLSIVAAAACMVGMCGLMMWAMMRSHRQGSRSRDQRHAGERRGQPT